MESLTPTPETNALIPTHSNESGNLIVSGRDLHEFLEVKTAYKDWFPRMAAYGFVEGMDYVTVAQKKSNSSRQHDHLHRPPHPN